MKNGAGVGECLHYLPGENRVRRLGHSQYLILWLPRKYAMARLKTCVRSRLQTCEMFPLVLRLKDRRTSGRWLFSPLDINPTFI